MHFLSWEKIDFEIVKRFSIKRLKCLVYVFCGMPSDRLEMIDKYAALHFHLLKLHWFIKHRACFTRWMIIYLRACNGIRFVSRINSFFVWRVKRKILAYLTFLEFALLIYQSCDQLIIPERWPRYLHLKDPLLLLEILMYRITFRDTFVYYSLTRLRIAVQRLLNAPHGKCICNVYKRINPSEKAPFYNKKDRSFRESMKVVLRISTFVWKLQLYFFIISESYHYNLERQVQDSLLYNKSKKIIKLKNIIGTLLQIFFAIFLSVTSICKHFLHIPKTIGWEFRFSRHFLRLYRAVCIGSFARTKTAVAKKVK